MCHSVSVNFEIATNFCLLKRAHCIRFESLEKGSETDSLHLSVPTLNNSCVGKGVQLKGGPFLSRMSAAEPSQNKVCTPGPTVA